MRNRTFNVSSLAQTAVGVLVGLLVLAGFFAPDLRTLVELFSRWTATIIAFALLLGLANVVRVHLGRITAQREDWPYSVVLVGSALAVIVIGLFGSRSAGDPIVQWIFQWLYQPIAASLSALFVFFVASAAMRALR